MNSEGHQRSTYEHYYHQIAQLCTPSSFLDLFMNTAIFKWIFEMNPNPPPVILYIAYTIQSWNLIHLQKFPNSRMIFLFEDNREYLQQSYHFSTPIVSNENTYHDLIYEFNYLFVSGSFYTIHSTNCSEILSLVCMSTDSFYYIYYNVLVPRLVDDLIWLIFILSQ